jgi:hypothetical protein
MRIFAKLSGVLGLAVLSAVTVLAVPASASPVPPVASSALVGTWVNTNTATKSVKQIVVQPAKGGSVLVDAFGACTPTLCEWGRVPAIVYGPNVSSTAGTSFQSNQRFLSGGKEWSRTELFGTVTRTKAGLRLTVREFTTFSDSSSRKNYTVTEVFALGRPGTVTKSGSAVTTYVLGHRPVMNAGMLGTWVPSGASSNLAKVVIGGPAASPVVHAFGACTPTPCDMGSVRGITYGATISTLRGTSAIAPYTFSFKKTQLLLKYTISSTDVETLTVVAYNEFTDGSGRSNYVVTQNLVRG